MEELSHKRVAYTEKQISSTVEPKYCSQSKHIFLTDGSALRVFSVKTGELLHSLQEHVAPISSIELVPGNPYQIFTSSLDGTVRLWDFQDAVCLKVHHVGRPILWMCLSSLGGGAYNAYVVVDMNRLETFSMTANSSMEESTEKTTLKRKRNTSSKNEKKKNKAQEKKPHQVIQDNMKTSTSNVPEWMDNYKPSQKWRLVEFNLVNNTMGRTIMKENKFHFQAASGRDINLLFENQSSSTSGCYIAVVCGKKVRFWDPVAQTLFKQSYYHGLVNVAMHPTRRCFVTGDEDGRMCMWFANDTQIVCESKLHWHAHATSSICFSSDGNYMLSGGEEAVLVVWQLDSGEQFFIPRLGAPIVSVAINEPGDSYLVATSDRTLRQISAISHREQWRVRSSETPISSGQLSTHALFRNGLVIDPLSYSIVLNGASTVGSLQFFNLEDKSAVRELHVTNRNQVSRTDREKVPETRVEHVSFNKDGKRCATVHGVVGSKQFTLQFWDYVASSQSYVMNTRVEDPHSGNVTSLVYHPTKDVIFSGGEDGTFKVWERLQQKKDFSMKENSTVNRSIWECRSVGTYTPVPVTAMAISGDGSLLAVAYGHIITLWDPFTNILRSTLTYCLPSEKIKYLGFAGRSPYLVSTSTSGVYVWNLLSNSLWWGYQVKHALVAIDNWNSQDLNPLLTIAIPVVDDETKRRRTSIVTFHIDMPNPIYISQVNDIAVQSIIYRYNNKNNTSEAIYMDDEARIWIISPKNEQTSPCSASKTKEQESTFHKMFGKVQNQSLSSSSQIVQQHKKEKDDSFFNAPSHTLPALSTFYRSFMDSLIIKQNKPLKVEEIDHETKLEKFKSQDTKIKVSPSCGKLAAKKETFDPITHEETFGKLVDFFKTIHE